MPLHDTSNWPCGVHPKQPGPVTLPSGRSVYSTGKVLIGVRHEHKPNHDKAVPHSHLWVQELLLGKP
jgi:hypothetical protein